MLFTAMVLVLLANSVLSQGVFDPPTFTENSCTGSYKWSMWFDTNDPSATVGDFEVTSHIKQLFSSFMCAAPIAIEGQTSVDGSPTTTGDVFRITVKDGFLCLNQQVTVYKNRVCNDYKVRYCCPATSI